MTTNEFLDKVEERLYKVNQIIQLQDDTIGHIQELIDRLENGERTPENEHLCLVNIGTILKCYNEVK